MVFIVEENSGIDSIDDLKGKNVEVLEGSSAVHSLNNDNSTVKDSFASLTEIKGYDSGFMDLEYGVCDALIADSGLAYYQVKENKNSKDFKILDEQLGGEQYGVGFKKGNTELRDQVQKTLDEMFKDGTVEKIAQKYSDYNIPECVIYPDN
jgi:polar amino acid transport system substrate-binding protein